MTAADTSQRRFIFNKNYGNTDCKAYHDYREMFANTDIAAVMLAVPDHWHAIISLDAAEARKDIYGEKPLARTMVEQRAIVKAVQKNKRIWQTGSRQRSVGNFHKAAEITWNSKKKVIVGDAEASKLPGREYCAP